MFSRPKKKCGPLCMRPDVMGGGAVSAKDGIQNTQLSLRGRRVEAEKGSRMSSESRPENDARWQPRLFSPGLDDALHSFLSFPTQTAWFCCFEADRFCVSASFHRKEAETQNLSTSKQQNQAVCVGKDKNECRGSSRPDSCHSKNTGAPHAVLIQRKCYNLSKIWTVCYD